MKLICGHCGGKGTIEHPTCEDLDAAVEWQLRIRKVIQSEKDLWRPWDDTDGDNHTIWDNRGRLDSISPYIFPL